jgi:hypothetical protein
MRKIFLILLILVCAAAVVTAQSGKKCTASGRIVDDNGNPVSEASIYTDTVYKDDIDVINVIYSPEKNGTFSVETPCDANSVTYFWITSKLHYKEDFIPVVPPFSEFAGKNKRYRLFAGIPVKGGGVKLGDLKIQIPYRNVRLNLQNETGGALFASRDDLANATFNIKNERGFDMTFRSAPDGEQLKNENIVRDSAILMSLPEGRWIIEIKPQKGKRLYADKLLEVKNTGEPVQQIVLRMSRKKSSNKSTRTN